MLALRDDRPWCDDVRLRRVFAFALSGNGDDAPVLARILLGTLFFNRLHIQQRAFDVFSDDRPVYLFFGTVGILHGQYACHEAAHCHGRGACHTQGVPSHAFLAELDAVCVHPSGERRYYAAFGTEFYGAGSEGLFLLVAVLLFLVNILCLWQTVSISRYTAMAARQEAELKLKGLEDTQYQNLLDTHKTLMGWRHDFFNHLSVIGQMIQTGRGDEALGYIAALRDNTYESSTMVNSGNLAVDSILNAKLPAARENGIRVSLRLEVPKMKTDPVDLCTLLGNLWDNAFEANMYLENHSERFIRLTVRPSDFFFSIHMENPVAPGREEQAESHESTKHLPGHGLGVGQIKKTVQKYDGVYSLRLAQPGRFVVDLLLPIDAAAPVEQVFVWESAKEALV